MTRVVGAGARVLMLPMVASPEEAATFVTLVNGRARVVLLVECRDAIARLSELIAVEGVDEVHVGLNDLALSLGLANRWLVLADDLMLDVGRRVIAAGLRFGLGGLGRAGDDTLPIPSDLVYAEHARTGATAALVSRSFHGARGLGSGRRNRPLAGTPRVLAGALRPASSRLAHLELGRRAREVPRLVTGDTPPTVSVAIRAFRRRWIAQAIRSVLAQTFTDLELVIYDTAGDLEDVVAAAADDARALPPGHAPPVRERTLSERRWRSAAAATSRCSTTTIGMSPSS